MRLVHFIRRMGEELATYSTSHQHCSPRSMSDSPNGFASRGLSFFIVTSDIIFYINPEELSRVGFEILLDISLKANLEWTFYTECSVFKL